MRALSANQRPQLVLHQIYESSAVGNPESESFMLAADWLDGLASRNWQCYSVLLLVGLLCDTWQRVDVDWPI